MHAMACFDEKGQATHGLTFDLKEPLRGSIRL